MDQRDREARDRAAKEFANRADAEPGSPEGDQAKERRAEAEKKHTHLI
jgi:hypothetical protein